MIPLAINSPWKIWNEIGRWFAYPSVRLLFALNGIKWGKRWRIYGIPIIQKHRRSWMSFGPGLRLRSSTRSNPLAPNHPVVLTTWGENSRLDVGADFAMTGGTICAAASITIGDNVAVGANSIIVDTDFHSMDPQVRLKKPIVARTAPVVIEDDVFIGMKCMILKGVKLGRGCVIGAGSIVTRDVPPRVIVAGNPAREIRQL